MAYKKHIANILRVLSGNLTTILSGVFVGLLLPKYMRLSDYGFLKTFTLYATYTGLFSLGITDGVMLLHGGEDYHELNRPAFRGYFRCFSWMLVLLGAAVMLWANFALTEDLRFIFIMIGLDLIAVNCLNYYRNITQMIQQFKLFSKRTTLEAALKAGAVVIFILLRSLGVSIGYRFYVIILVLVNYSLLIWYLLSYRDIIIGPASSFKDIKQPFGWMIKKGFPVLCANLTATLIMALDRQFVSVLFPNDDYAVYAFAYNMLSLVTVAISAISTVFFPFLKRSDRTTLETLYEPMKFAISVVVYGALASFFPLGFIVRNFLPQYIPSMEFFRIIFPGLAISSSIMSVMHNYYKTYGKSNAYFVQSLFVLGISAVLNLIAYKLAGTMASISVASIFTLMIWYAISNRSFQKQFIQTGLRSIGYLIVMMIVFYAVTTYDRGLLGFGVYVIVFILLSVVFGWKYIRTVCNLRRSG